MKCLGKLKISKANMKDIDMLYALIGEMALFEKRPQDRTGTKEELEFWLFEKKIATALIAEIDGEAIGYAIFYPIFASFSAKGKAHLEDIFIREQFRGKGFGRILFNAVVNFCNKLGLTAVEWSCLDWNKAAIGFYNKLGAKRETGRFYFSIKI